MHTLLGKAAQGTLEDETLIRLDHISKSYGPSEVLKDVSLEIRKGEFVSVLGPSGSGKSTLFNIITGLVPADKGTLQVNGEIGYMQQKDLLLPWKTVLDNIVLPLDLKGSDKKASRAKADSLIDRVGLRGYEHCYPSQLSGGMKQRASFLRTFLSSGEIMLLDEPFGALDSITKGSMQAWLLEVQEALDVTILFITHDIEEAIFLSDRIYVLSSRPGVVKEEIAVGFGSENKRERLVDPELLRMKEAIKGLL
ncbi:nitrate ABC transporter ATP-binding protein [Paenibacillus baekrokdamisoli]|uniref:Nitrate ABC transporter ATP-binding protein n=1 Tax=Paenibacillus baekrokdamisoli TaxID=1712516 RepID=A0A3G9IXM8_9BACL|nr:ABC transporter ATP-binding protein [Paenibacillus baekrokdamisoli]MBB3073294.1 ABC-type nitrate/sulfonate/bicarbonate transport system ATPase subunit [Paenibacillus baekrokdamisoli]BBH23276.1 nitrate ABC transporter ATP-binding protein [Paenibacillus baekrokdamisoli]